MAAPPLGSLLVGSSQVDAMKDFYRNAFDVKENDMGAFDFGGVQLFIEEHSQVSGPTKEPARIILNLNVDDARGLAKRVEGTGASFERPLEQADFGLIATVKDPDGNLVQLIQWGATPEAHKS
jgi:predicted enzyme related to lactoylglutathione lyase